MPEQLRPYVEELMELNVRTIFLWGAEYWHYRKVQHEDTRWWDEVAALLESLKPQRPQKE